jgi:hypothetical protein
VTWPSAAHAATTPTFIVIHQGAITKLSSSGHARFSATFKVQTLRKSAVFQVSLYPRIITRSQLASIVDGSGTSSPVESTTGNLELDCLSHGKATFTIALFTTTAVPGPSPCESRPARLHLACTASQCDGVYPLSYSVTSNNVTTTKWSLLTVQASRVVRPLLVDLIDTLDPSTLHHVERSTAVLNAFALHPTVPFTLSADYRTLGAVEQMTTPPYEQWRDAFNKVLDSPLHRVVAAPPSDIDFAGLASNGFPSQVDQQLSLSNQVLRAVSGRYEDGTVLLSGTPSLATVKALVKAHVSDVVVPDDSLNPPPSSTLNWGAPFRFSGITSLTALSTDAPLEQLATNSSIEPGRRAAMTLSTLSFLHFEAPDAPATRTVVLEMANSKLSRAYVSDLLGGFAGDPYILPSSLTPSFTSSLVATNGAPATRVLSSSATSTWSARNTFDLRTLIGQVNSFNQAVGSSTVADSLSVAVARAEVVGSPSERQNALATASAQLTAQLSNFSVDGSSITLTGPGTAIPITILSRANYSVTAIVHLITDRLSFPKGNRVVVELNSSTKSLRVPTANHRGSDLTLQVVVTSPNGQLVLARTAIQVRIAGNSVVGYLLSFGSLFVLGFWWLRTHRRTTKGRHAR